MATLKLGVYVPPMLAATTEAIPGGDAWAAELKWDGVRIQAHVEAGRARLYTRRGRDVTGLLPELAGLAEVIGDGAVVDGELVVQAPDGSPQFSAVMGRLTGGRFATPAVTFVAFDLLIDKGQPTVGLPYLERRRRLEQRPRVAPSWYLPEYVVGQGADLFVAAVRRGLEGIVVKRVDSPYRPGARVDVWRKVLNTEHPAYRRVERSFRR